MRTPSRVAVLSILYTLYFASLPVSAAVNNPKSYAGAMRQLSDQNLFEAHLQKQAPSHKRLPSEILGNRHGERSEGEAEEGTPGSLSSSAASIVAAATAEADASSAPTATATSTTSTQTDAEAAFQTFSPRQPSHLIAFNRHKNGKRRLDNGLFGLARSNLKFKRDSDDVPSLWSLTQQEQRAMASTPEPEEEVADASSLGSAETVAEVVAEASDSLLRKLNKPSLLHDLHLLFAQAGAAPQHQQPEHQ